MGNIKFYSWFYIATDWKMWWAIWMVAVLFLDLQ